MLRKQAARIAFHLELPPFFRTGEGWGNCLQNETISYYCKLNEIKGLC